MARKTKTLPADTINKPKLVERPLILQLVHGRPGERKLAIQWVL